MHTMGAVLGAAAILLAVTACGDAGQGPGVCMDRDGRSVCLGPDGATMSDGEGGQVQIGRDGAEITGGRGSGWVELEADPDGAVAVDAGGAQGEVPASVVLAGALNWAGTARASCAVSGADRDIEADLGDARLRIDTAAESVTLVRGGDEWAARLDGGQGQVVRRDSSTALLGVPLAGPGGTVALTATISC